MAIIVGNGLRETSSNPGRDGIFITQIPLGKMYIQLFFHAPWVISREVWKNGDPVTLNYNLLPQDLNTRK